MIGAGLTHGHHCLSIREETDLPGDWCRVNSRPPLSQHQGGDRSAWWETNPQKVWHTMRRWRPYAHMFHVQGTGCLSGLGGFFSVWPFFCVAWGEQLRNPNLLLRIVWKLYKLDWESGRQGGHADSVKPSLLMGEGSGGRGSRVWVWVGGYALSASKAIFRVRTTDCITLHTFTQDVTVTVDSNANNIHGTQYMVNTKCMVNIISALNLPLPKYSSIF